MSDNYYEKDFETLLAKSKHSIEIVSILNDEETLTHNELAKRLGIKKNNLSNVMSKIGLFNIIFARRIGRNVYYSLNAKGQRFYEYIKNNGGKF